MRKIKFRAWDKMRKVMIGSDYPDNWGWDKDEWYADVRMMELIGIEGISSNKDFEVMQFTGLKDKNGKEIYEGDILIDDNYPEDGISYAVVEWEESEKIVGWFAKPWGNEKEFFTDYEIVGNIYENPELL